MNFSIRHFYLLIILLQTSSIFTFSQPSFDTQTHRDTLCFDDFVSFTDIKVANKYAWDFCAPDMSKDPSSGNISIPSGTIDGPAFISTVDADGGIYAFVTNYNNGTITRMFFSDINSAPSAVNIGSLGDKVPIFPEGIKVLQESDGNYYGFVVGGQNPNFKIVRLDFGASLSNTPTVVELTSIFSSLNYPKGISIKKGDTWVGYITNYGSNSITQLTFQNGLSQTPTVQQITNVPLKSPIGIQLINDNSGKWFAFVSNFGGTVSSDYSITRIKFTDKLGGAYTSDVIKNTSLDRPFDITFFENCDKKYGYVLNSFSNAVQMIFNESLAETPEFKPIGMDAFSNPHGISELFRLGNSINVLVSHTASSAEPISRIYYQSPCDASYHLWSDKPDPDPFKYPFTGNYNISLETQDATGLKSFYCKPVLVEENPHFNMGPDTSICPGKAFLAPVIPDSIGTIFQQDSIPQFSGNDGSSYLLKRTYINQYGCTFRDSILITKYLKALDLGPDIDETYGAQHTFDAGANFKTYHWNTGEISQQITVNKEGSYIANVTSMQDCAEKDTVELKYHKEIPNYLTPNSSVQKRWDVPFLKNFPKADVKIYDRFGNLVAAYKGGLDGWDGNCNGRPLAADAYWYFIDLHNGDNILKGSVSIIR